MNLETLKSIELHFVGIGGSGMSGLARIALAMGIKVSGSDLKDSPTIKELSNLGVKTFIGHKPENLNRDCVLVVSSAIESDNVELIRASELSLPILTRAEALAIFMEGKFAIAIAGTHGKTTTTSMLTVAFQSLGLDPSFAIGGSIARGGTNAHFGSGNYFVAEADESDGSFLAYKPHGAVVTNIELDHVDNFPNIEAILDLFENFVASIKSGGFLVICIDGENQRKLLDHVKRDDLTIISYGQSNADLTYSHLYLKPTGAMARIVHGGKILGELETSVPGEHNLLNALAVIGVGIATNQPVSELMNGIKNFTGARRRFEIKGAINGITVVDDYGHHPTEIEVTLKAARNFIGEGRIFVIFQPHRYSRTATFVNEFANSLRTADKVYLLEVYGAGENPIPGISSKLIADQLENATFNPSMVEVIELVAEEAKPGDLILTLGAGDVSSLGPAILESLNEI